MRIILFLLLFVSFSIPGFAQTKYEKEVRIDKGEVPGKALEFVDQMNFTKKVRWYKEIGFSTNSFEAKTKHKGKRYSIEFSENGTFEDVEIEIKENEIPANTLRIIKTQLQKEYEQFSIQKIQVQFSGDPNLVLQYLRNKEPSIEILIHYEIVISARMEGSFKVFEHLYSESGDFVKKAKVKLKRTDNLEY
jgi:hypothetical protein